MKRKIIVLVVLGLIAISSGLARFTVAANNTESDESPCKESMYLAMKAKNIDALSPREYEVFKTKDAACLQYQQSIMNNKSQEKNTKTLASSGNGLNWLYAILTLATIAAVLG